jgi:hypothetical protein
VPQQQCYSGGEPSSGGDSSDEKRSERKPKRRDHSGGGDGSDGHVQIGGAMTIIPRIQMVCNRLTDHADVSAGKHPLVMRTHQIMKSRGDRVIQGVIAQFVVRIVHPLGKNSVGKVHGG